MFRSDCIEHGGRGECDPVVRGVSRPQWAHSDLDAITRTPRQRSTDSASNECARMARIQLGRVRSCGRGLGTIGAPRGQAPWRRCERVRSTRRYRACPGRASIVFRSDRIEHGGRGECDPVVRGISRPQWAHSDLDAITRTPRQRTTDAASNECARMARIQLGRVASCGRELGTIGAPRGQAPWRRTLAVASAAAFNPVHLNAIAVRFRGMSVRQRESV